MRWGDDASHGGLVVAWERRGLRPGEMRRAHPGSSRRTPAVRPALRGSESAPRIRARGASARSDADRPRSQIYTVAHRTGHRWSVHPQTGASMGIDEQLRRSNHLLRRRADEAVQGCRSERCRWRQLHTRPNPTRWRSSRMRRPRCDDPPFARSVRHIRPAWSDHVHPRRHRFPSVAGPDRLRTRRRLPVRPSARLAQR
jgi:hypothetical protein